MSYLVLARRFRPQTFEDIVGQEHVTQTLANAIRSGRVAHAFLFAGARGVGKTTAARVLAKALNCVDGPTVTPCGVCAQCEGIASSRAVDVQEIDGASNNSVDDIRALREAVPFSPSSGRFKIYIVDEVHMLTTSAFNALLKTLEEPPAHVKFIFATTEPHRIPVTILSRCQRYDFRRVPTALIQGRLRDIARAERVEADEGAVALLAREADGSMRDALSLLDQALAFDPERLEGEAVSRLLGVADRQILFDLGEALLGGNAAGALGAVEKVSTFGVDPTRFCHDLLRHLRNLVVQGQCPGAPELVDVPDDERAELERQVRGRDPAELHRLFMLFARASEEVARSPYPRLLLEMTLARLAALEPMSSLEELAGRLDQVASRLGAGPAAPGSLPRRGADGPAGGSPAPRSRPEGASRTSPPAAAPTEAPGGAAPAGVGAAPVGPPDPELWQRLLAHIEKEAPPLYHMLRFAEPLSVGRSELRVVLPNNPFLRGEARNSQRIDALKAACRTVLGGEPAVSIEVADGKGGSPLERQHIERAARVHERQREATEHDIVRAALTEFEGARLHEVKLHDDE